MTIEIITSVPLVDPLDTMERVLGILWRRLAASYFNFPVTEKSIEIVEIIIGLESCCTDDQSAEG